MTSWYSLGSASTKAPFPLDLAASSVRIRLYGRIVRGERTHVNTRSNGGYRSGCQHYPGKRRISRVPNRNSSLIRHPRVCPTSRFHLYQYKSTATCSYVWDQEPVVMPRIASPPMNKETKLNMSRD